MSYVYIHRRKDTGEIFYIGKGNDNRFKESNGRSSKWNLIVKESGGFVPEIYKDNLSEKEALALERDLIEQLKESIVNYTQAQPFDYDSFDWANKYYYDVSSKSCLKYKSDNSDVGSFHMCGSVGYWNTSIKQNGKTRFIKVHRIIWTMLKGSIPEGYIINHINNISSDNRIENLELCTFVENATKSKVVKNKENDLNSYIFRRVFKVKIKDGTKDYPAVGVSVARDERKFSRVFSTNKYSEEIATELAKSWLFDFFEFGVNYADKMSNIRRLKYILEDDNFGISLVEKENAIVVRLGKSITRNRILTKRFYISKFNSLSDTKSAALSFRNSIIEGIINDYNYTATSCT